VMFMVVLPGGLMVVHAKLGFFELRIKI
jgi:hypothetical protein